VSKKAVFRHCERSEAIHTGTLDCFTLRVRNDGAAGRLHQSPVSLSALLECTVFFPMTTTRPSFCDNLNCTVSQLLTVTFTRGFVSFLFLLFYRAL
jgi:hypothetical protein